MTKGVAATGPLQPDPEPAWDAIRERVERRARRGRRLRWAAWIAPLVVAAGAVPAAQMLASAGRTTHVVVGPSIPVTPTQPASTETGNAAGVPAGTTTLNVAPCPVDYGVTGNPPVVPDVTITTAGASAGIAAYGGPMTLLGPTGWSCRGLVAADGNMTLVVVPPGASPPPLGQTHTGQAVQEITGYIVSASGAHLLYVGCPLFAEAAADAAAQSYPCGTTPAGEIVQAVRPGVVAFTDPAGVAGDGNLSGGPNVAQGVAWYSSSAQSAGRMTCTVAAPSRALCTALLSDFLARYAPSATTTSPLRVTSCPNVVMMPQSSDLALNVSAVGVDCATATSVVRAVRGMCPPGQTMACTLDPKDYRALGFHCLAGTESAQAPGGGMTYVPYGCRNGDQQVTFFKYA